MSGAYCGLEMAGRERRHSKMMAFKSVSLNLVPMELDTWLMDYICCWPLLSSFSCLSPFAHTNTFYLKHSCCTLVALRHVPGCLPFVCIYPFRCSSPSTGCKSQS